MLAKSPRKSESSEIPRVRTRNVKVQAVKGAPPILKGNLLKAQYAYLNTLSLGKLNLNLKEEAEHWEEVFEGRPEGFVGSAFRENKVFSEEAWQYLESHQDSELPGLKKFEDDVEHLLSKPFSFYGSALELAAHDRVNICQN